MENHSYSSGRNLLAAGKSASAVVFACGHVVVTVAGLRLGFSREDFADFAEIVDQAAKNLRQRDREISDWELFF